MTASTVVRTRVRGGFWGERLAVNARRAIRHQWEQLENTGCLDNFRLASGRAEGFRSGLFFADSDAYKWLDAAARMLDDDPDPELRERVDELVGLLEAAQASDGYLYTYNQLLFPGQRWRNLQLEHEMYCLGHLIEAGVSHHLATGETRLLNLVRRSADLLVREFLDAPASQIDGHEEVEIALLRLHRVTGDPAYLELARRLLERRGRLHPFSLHLVPQFLRTAGRILSVTRREKAYFARHPARKKTALPPLNKPKVPPVTWLRLLADLCSGRNFQQHLPLRRQTVPVGHAVRFTYLETAAAMLCRESDDRELQAVLETAWEHMVRRRMYVTGGLGSLPLIEGFGRDDELDPEIAYAETCAAIGSLLWNREMAELTGEPRYDDLFEWQLYNAAAVGMGWEGDRYLYNNPLACRGRVARAPWYLVPCCPSNLSRTWAGLGEHVCRADAANVYVAQYVGSEVRLEWGTLKIDSGLPWSGAVRIEFETDGPTDATLHLRLPSWADGYGLRRNGTAETADSISPAAVQEAACGYTPTAARWLTVRRPWRAGDVLELDLGMPIRLYRQQPQVTGCGGKLAVARGPLVYCLESVDNPGEIFDVALPEDSLAVDRDADLFGGIVTIAGTATDGRPLKFVPYMLWGNRGPSCMNVFVNGAAVTNANAT